MTNAETLLSSIAHMQVRQEDAFEGDLREVMRVTWDNFYAEVISTNPGGIVIALYSHKQEGWNCDDEYPHVTDGRFYRFPALGSAIEFLAALQSATIDTAI